MGPKWFCVCPVNNIHNWKGFLPSSLIRGKFLLSTKLKANVYAVQASFISRGNSSSLENKWDFSELGKLQLTIIGQIKKV